jgi:hypothetical protein
MRPELWRQVEQLYHGARERQLDERAAFFAQAEPELRLEVESLLAEKHRVKVCSIVRPGSCCRSTARAAQDRRATRGRRDGPGLQST